MEFFTEDRVQGLRTDCDPSGGSVMEQENREGLGSSGRKKKKTLSAILPKAGMKIINNLMPDIEALNTFLINEWMNELLKDFDNTPA